MRWFLAFLASILAAVPAAFSQVQPPVPMEQMPPPDRDPLKFTILPPNPAQQPVVGQDYAYSFCLGVMVPMPKPGSTSGLTNTRLDPVLSPCGTDQNPSPLVSGGSAPYHFEIDSGGFPPLGMILDLNGVLRGRPASGMAAEFRVCAVDTRGWKECHPVRITPALAQQQGKAAKPQQVKKGGGAGTALLIGGVAAAGAVAAGVAAANAANQQATETKKKTCPSGSGDCGDSHCCSVGSGCCGLYNGSEKCCPTGYPHYCPSLDKCYQTIPTCDFTVCHAFMSWGPGPLAAKASGAAGLHRGNPNAPVAAGVPPMFSCPTR